MARAKRQYKAKPPQRIGRPAPGPRQPIKPKPGERIGQPVGPGQPLKSTRVGPGGAVLSIHQPYQPPKAKRPSTGIPRGTRGVRKVQPLRRATKTTAQRQATRQTYKVRQQRARRGTRRATRQAGRRRR